MMFKFICSQFYYWMRKPICKVIYEGFDGYEGVMKVLIIFVVGCGGSYVLFI